MLASKGERIPPCGVPVNVARPTPDSERIPERRNDRTNARTRLSETLAATLSIRAR